MLVDENLADIRPPYRAYFPFVQPDPQQAIDPETGEPLVDPDTGEPVMLPPDVVLDEETGEPKTTDYIQHPSSIERDWTDEQLAEAGLYRLYIDPRPEGVRIVDRPREFRTIDGVQQAWQGWATEPFPASKELANAERTRLYQAGTTLDLGDGMVVPVDIRNTDDENNIQGLFSFGQEMVKRDISTTTTFRGSDNQDYDLTVPQLIEMGLQVMAFKSTVYAAARVVKDEIEAGTLTDAVGIPAAFQAILGAP